MILQKRLFVKLYFDSVLGALEKLIKGKKVGLNSRETVPLRRNHLFT